MAITDGANRNPASSAAGQPQANTDAAVRATAGGGGQGIRGGGDAPTGPGKMPGQDAGTAAAMKAGTTKTGGTKSNGNG